MWRKDRGQDRDFVQQLIQVVLGMSQTCPNHVLRPRSAKTTADRLSWPRSEPIGMPHIFASAKISPSTRKRRGLYVETLDRGRQHVDLVEISRLVACVRAGYTTSCKKFRTDRLRSMRFSRPRKSNHCQTNGHFLHINRNCFYDAFLPRIVSVFTFTFQSSRNAWQSALGMHVFRQMTKA